MPIVDYQRRTVRFHIAYCGVPTVGKATTLHTISSGCKHSVLTPVTVLEHKDGSKLTTLGLSYGYPSLVRSGLSSELYLHCLPGTKAFEEKSLNRLFQHIDGLVFVVSNDFESLPTHVTYMHALLKQLDQRNLSLERIPWVLQVNIHSDYGLSVCGLVDYLPVKVGDSLPVRIGEHQDALSVLEKLLSRFR